MKNLYFYTSIIAFLMSSYTQGEIHTATYQIDTSPNSKYSQKVYQIVFTFYANINHGSDLSFESTEKVDNLFRKHAVKQFVNQAKKQGVLTDKPSMGYETVDLKEMTVKLKSISDVTGAFKKSMPQITLPNGKKVIDTSKLVGFDAPLDNFVSDYIVPNLSCWHSYKVDGEEYQVDNSEVVKVNKAAKSKVSDFIREDVNRYLPLNGLEGNKLIIQDTSFIKYE